MSESNTIFSGVSLARDLEDQDATDLLVDITDMSFGTDIALPQADQAIIFFVAGYIARSIQKSLKCKSCCLLLSTGETRQAQMEGE